MIREITIGGFDPSAPFYWVKNSEGVVYRANSFDALIRAYVQHTQKRAVMFGTSNDEALVNLALN